MGIQEILVACLVTSFIRNTGTSFRNLFKRESADEADKHRSERKAIRSVICVNLRHLRILVVFYPTHSIGGVRITSKFIPCSGEKSGVLTQYAWPRNAPTPGFVPNLPILP